MKIEQKRAVSARWCVALLTTLALSSLAQIPALAATPVATVRTVRGNTYRRAKGQTGFPPLAVRTGLFSGDVVGTGPGGRLALLFSDGASVRLNENSAIEITPSGQSGKSSLFRAVEGELWARLRPGNTALTRTVALGVRGTEILLQVAAGDGTTTLTVIEGEVQFFNQFGQVVVGTAQQSTARPGQAPTAPLTIQTPGLLIEWTLDLDRAALPREKSFRGAPGDELFNKRNFAGALLLYQAATQRTSNDNAAHERLGWALLELDRLEESEAQFQLAGENAPVLTGLAWLELSRARADKAEDFANRALAIAANDEARVALGAAQLRGGKADHAVATLRAVAENSPLRPAASSWLALALLAQNDMPGALREAQNAVKAGPDSALAQSSLATAALFANRPGEASRAAKIAAMLMPDDVTGQTVLAQSLLARGDADAAARAAARAVALDPQSPQARYLLGVAEAGQRDYSHAARELREALRLAPDFLPAASALARVFNAMNRPREATALLEERLARDERGEVEGALGEVLYEQGNYALAATHLRAALTKQPSSALRNDALARALLYDNQLTDAIIAGRKAVQLAPTIGAYHATLGLAYDFSRLYAQAEREFRTALTFDPQNALALTQLALKQAGTDLRSQASSLAQGFIYDPALERKLLRGGVNAEVTPFVGDNGQLGVDLTHRGTYAEGKLHGFSSVHLNRDDGERPNSDTHLADAAGYLTAVPDPATNFYATLRRQDARGGLAGSLSAPDSDDRTKFRFNEAQIAGRRRLSGGSHLWAGVCANAARNDTIDAGLNSFTDLISGLPVQRQRFDSTGFVPELRFDAPTGGASRSGVLTLGLARTRTDFDSRRELRVPVGAGLGTARISEDDRVWLAYGQWAGRLGERFALNAQLRAWKRRQGRASTVILPGRPDSVNASARDETRLLPAVLASYQATRHTTLRFAYNQRVTESTVATFLPTETLISTQSAALPFGMPLRLNLTQFDIEHYAGTRGFLKLFVFHSTASDVQIGQSDLLGFGSGLPAPNAPVLNFARWQAQGAGARYEHQLTRSLFASAGFAHRSTRADGVDDAPYEPNNLADAGLNYVSPRGNKAGLQWRHQGAIFADTPLTAVRPRFGSGNFVDLTLAREPSVRHEYFLKITNLFDHAQFLFNGFPGAGRRVQAGYTRRF